MIEREIVRERFWGGGGGERKKEKRLRCWDCKDDWHKERGRIEAQRVGILIY